MLCPPGHRRRVDTQPLANHCRLPRLQGGEGGVAAGGIGGQGGTFHAPGSFPALCGGSALSPVELQVAKEIPVQLPCLPENLGSIGRGPRLRGTCLPGASGGAPRHPVQEEAKVFEDLVARGDRQRE